MSISACIADWLRGYVGNGEIIDIDQMAAMPDAYGLFRAPETIYTPFVNGSRDVSAYYQFVIRRQSQTDAQREETAEEIENLESWIHAQCMARRLPVLDNGRVCHSISVTGGMALESQDETASEYQIMMHINYFEE